MNLNVNFKEASVYPFKDKHWRIKLLIFTVMIIIL
jgi:hypothetical protein